MSAQPPGPPPSGPPSGPPPAGPPPLAGPAATSGGGHGVSWKAPAIVALVVVLALGVVLAVVAFSSDDTASASQVTLEPVSSPGTNPFMASVGTDQANVTPPPQAGGAFTGSTPGLYGGTLNISSCDAQRMVTFLQQNPDKAGAWASVLGITAADIPRYVSELTPVILRSDVAVTNHGFLNGSATAIPAVLEAGTAVLVDKYGFPVVKCFCGNPLTRPRVYASPTYIGSRWSGFSPVSITIIQKTTVIVDTFTLVDPATGRSFTRPRGSAGSSDRPSTPATTPTTPSTAPPATSTTTAPRPPPTQTTKPPGPSPQEQAAAKLDRGAQQCYPFPAPIEDSTSSSKSFEPRSNPNFFILQVVTQTVSGGTQTFRWEVNGSTLQFTPLNDLAQAASSHCPILN